MIRPRYGLKLARTKLHSKRGVLIASIVVASLLFAILIAAVIVFSGAEKSANIFVKKAGNDRYLVKVSPVIPWEKLTFGGQLSPEKIREIKAFEKKYYEDLRAKYESLNLEYDDTSEVPALQPAAWMSDEIPEEQRVMINRQSPVITALEAQKYTDYAKIATNKFGNLQTLGNTYGANGYYAQYSSKLPPIPSTRLIQDGKEDFGSSDMKSGDMSSYGYYVNSIYNSQYAFQDERVLSRYLLPQEGIEVKGVPVVVSAQETASLFGKQFGIGEEPKDVTAKTQWLKDIQTKLNGHTYQACYRNTAEQALLSKIQRDYADVKNNEDNKDYLKPSLQYDYPTTTCGDIVVKEDTRTNSEKNATSAAEAAQKKLGTYVAPEHRLITFQIVGVVNARPFIDYATSTENYIKSLLAPQDISMTAIIPLQSYQALPDELKLGDLGNAQQYGPAFTTEVNEEFSPRILEFASIEDARNFLNNETCPGSEINCAKQYSGDPYGSNYLILDEIGKLFAKVASIAFPIILGLAAIIIWFTISRIMAENRKETAVYRAMGAKRPDIAAIYGTYVLLVALQIALVSLILGIAVAYAVDLVYGSQLTDTATAAFGIVDNAPRFSLFNLSSPLVWVVVTSIFIISLVASIQPLVRNVLRSPIRDIREE